MRHGEIERVIDEGCLVDAAYVKIGLPGFVCPDPASLGDQRGRLIDPPYVLPWASRGVSGNPSPRNRSRIQPASRLDRASTHGPPETPECHRYAAGSGIAADVRRRCPRNLLDLAVACGSRRFTP
jgi:hypothetical protein